MLFVYGLVALVLLVYCVLDILTSPREQIRTLPRPLWLLLVLVPLAGPAAWLLAGRPPRGTQRSPLRTAQPPERGAPDDDEEFLRDLRRRLRDPRDD